MTISSDPKEERSYARALARMTEHVGPCGDCAESVRAAEAKNVSLGGDPPPQPVLDLLTAELCPRGFELRLVAVMARASTPAERLIRFYALELAVKPAEGLGASDVPPTRARGAEPGRSLEIGPGDDDDEPDEDDDEDVGVSVPVSDAHDCERAAAWLREDIGRARAILTQLEDRAGPLEERGEPVADLREAFLVGFRRVSPSRGPVPIDEQKAKRAVAADRLVAVVADRYANRHGAPPPADALESFRRGHDMWIEGSGDLERMAADAEKFRAEHRKRWATKALLPPRDPLNELKKTARWIAEGLIGEEVGKG